MRILMLSPHEGIKGPMPTLAALLARGLNSLGCEVVIEPWGRHSDRESLFQKTVSRPRDVARIRRRASVEQPDFVLIQTTHEWKSMIRDLLVVRAVRGCAPRLVLQFHGGHFDRLGRPGHRLFKWVTAALIRMSDGVFVLSSEARDDLVAFSGRLRVYVVSNPFVEVRDWKERSHAARPTTDALLLLFVGRLIPEKGIRETVEAIALLSDRRPCRLLVVGEGRLVDEISEDIRRRGLSSRVTLAGYLSRDQLAEAYRRADVFVLPSYREGFPTVLAEAMSAGLPVVATRAGGTADHLREGVNALFVPPRNVHELSRTIERLLEDPAMRERMSKANRRKVKDFAPDVVAKDYIRALEEICL